MLTVIATLAVYVASIGAPLGALAYPIRAGTCAAGPAISSKGQHAADTSGSLATAGYQVTLSADNTEVSFINAVATIPPGDYKIALKATKTDKPFKGFLFRMGPKDNDGDAEGFFSNPDSVSQILEVDSSGTGVSGSISETTCDSGVAAFCHTNHDEKQETSVSLKATGSGTYTLDVTVVRATSEWYYTSFTVIVKGTEIKEEDPEEEEDPSGAHGASFTTSVGGFLFLATGWLLF